ncbi:MAG TPA: glycosyltransferase family 2 protein [Rhodanobacteraceae bacterium]|nr:glycosyltransferase family 2 protein [Rhodanobacteraceae bacterium]
MDTSKITSASVVLCTYNGERYLPQLWRSLLAQTRLPEEIVVRDDASTDTTFALLGTLREEARARGIQVTLARNEHNLGFVGNFEAALADAGGEIVFLCDQDDIWHPQKIALMLAQCERRPDLLLLHSDARLVDEAGGDMHCGLFEALEVTRRERRRVHRGHAFEALLRRNLATGATLAFRRSLLQAVTPFPPEWVHDEWLAIVAAALGNVDCLERPLIDYRQHGGNQIGARKRSFSDKIARIGQARLPFLQGLELRMGILLRHFETQLASRVPRRHVEAVRHKLEHLRARLALPPSRLHRPLPILREIATGRYSRYSTGPRAILLDLVNNE